MSSDWEEVKRLAADFQRTQMSGSLQRLSERNCIEIIKKLQELNLLDVIYTCDGREYLTPDQLLREIEDELYISNGRIAITELSVRLNVDYVHCESKAHQLSRQSQGEISLVLGQLISKQFKDLLAQEIDLKLQENGLINLNDFIKSYDLPSDFIENVITERLGTIVHGKQDQNDAKIILTEEYLSQFQSRICGVLSGCTKPISIQTLINKYKFPERIFNSCVSSLISAGRLSGVLSGRLYIPNVYAKTQSEFIESFYKQNGYLDYATLNRIGITNPQNFIDKKFPNELCHLNSCAVGQLIMFQVESSIEECINNNNFVDLIPLLPSILSIEDVHLLIEKTFEQNKQLSDSSVILCETIVLSKTFIQKCYEFFDSQMKKKAENDFKSGLLLSVFAGQQQTKESKTQQEVEEKKLDVKSQQKKGQKKSSGGSQGREVKTKNVKKKYKTSQKQTELSDDETQSIELQFLSIEEIIEILQKNIPSNEELTEELINALAEYMNEPLKTKYFEIAKLYFINATASNVQTKKQTFADIQKNVNQIYANIFMFEKGIQLLNDDLKNQLTKYLLRSLCTEIVNILVLHLTNDETASIATTEVRSKLINRLNGELKDDLMKLHNSLTQKSLEEFHKELNVCCEKMEIFLKKIDKKKERLIQSEHRQTLIMQLNQSNDFALTLHLAVLIQFQLHFNEMIHASGKFVPLLITFLRSKLDAEIYRLFYEFQELVMKQLTLKDDESEEKSLINEKLELSVPKIKEIALSKTSQN